MYANACSVAKHEGLHNSPLGQSIKSGRSALANQKAEQPKVAKVSKITVCTIFHRADCKLGQFKASKNA